MTVAASPARTGVGAEEAQLKLLLERGLEGGDSAAYRQFLSVTSALLRRYVEGQLRRSGREVGDAEDIVQEALLAIHAKRHTYDGHVPVTAWLYAIARYKLIDFLRRRRPGTVGTSLSDAEHVESRSDEHVESGILARQLMAALPQRLRAAVEMTKIEGLSVAEAAARSGMSEASVKVNVHRGLKAMARLFQGSR